MEHLDPQMAQRVWQRVQGTPTQPPLSALVLLLNSCAAGCARLGKYFRGQEAQLLQMRWELLRQAACVQGIHRLRTGEVLSTPASPPTPEPADVLLRRCIGQCLRLREALLSQSAEAEYGPVFAHMAAQTTSHICLLLELAGK